MTASILVVDDDPVQRRLAHAALSRLGHEVLVADGGAAALAALDGDSSFSAMVLDLGMPDMDGIDVLAAMRERGIDIPVIVLTAQEGVDTVVTAMRGGAFDFVVKPASPERLCTAVSNALKVGALEVSGRHVSGRGGVITFSDIVTRSPVMEKVVGLARKAAASNIPIVIEGESGVGKELVARAVQGSGDRRTRPFVTVNCGAIPENLVESTLFGHEKGAFTGATEKHTGKFVEAHTGTLFLDEIGDLSLDVQVKLLRAVQSGEVEPIGGAATVKVDIRLISATNRDLLRLVKEGAFREDLFYRLNVYPILVPPLRDRREDIPHLVRHFMAGVTQGDRAAPRINAIGETALAMLGSYDWPGNIRQLENAVFRACVLCEGDVLTEDDFPHIRAQVEGSIDLDRAASSTPTVPSAVANIPSPAPPSLPQTTSYGIIRALNERGHVRELAQVEMEMILLAVERYDGRMSEVARRLGIGRSTLYRKLREYGIDPGEGRSDSGPS